MVILKPPHNAGVKNTGVESALRTNLEKSRTGKLKSNMYTIQGRFDRELKNAQVHGPRWTSNRFVK